eukprot:8955574-Alexandrium_andersonii.AAC.1
MNAVLGPMKRQSDMSDYHTQEFLMRMVHYGLRFGMKLAHEEPVGLGTSARVRLKCSCVAIVTRP